MQRNKEFFEKLQAAVRKALLTELPAMHRSENGEDFLSDDLDDTVMCYNTLQAMRSKERDDPKHTDGAASWIHGGLSQWGKRKVVVDLIEEKCGLREVVLYQHPGELYMGPLCTAEHQVEHYPEKDAEPLFHPDGSDEGASLDTF